MTQPDGGKTQAHLLGEVIMEWSKVTLLLEELFAQLAGLDDFYVLRVLLDRIRDAQIDDVCRKLTGRVEETQRDVVFSWLHLVKEARAKRNAYLHGVYVPFLHSDGQLHTHVLGRVRLDNERGVVEPDLTKLTRSDLMEFRDAVLRIHAEFPAFLARPSLLGG